MNDVNVDVGDNENNSPDRLLLATTNNGNESDDGRKIGGNVPALPGSFLHVGNGTTKEFDRDV